MRRPRLLALCFLLVAGCRSSQLANWTRVEESTRMPVPTDWLAPEPTVERRWVGPTTGVGLDLTGAGWTQLDSDASDPAALPGSGWQPASLPAPATPLAARYRWLRRQVQSDVPGARLLTVGHIVGDDVLFVDGAAVDSTEGDGVSDQGRPRLYTISSPSAGSHTLLLRIGGTGSTRTVGLVRAPLALSPAGAVRTDTLKRWPIQPTRLSPGWRAMLPSAARFARITDDGYLTLDLDPTGIELHPLPGSGRTRLELDADSVETVAVERLSWIGKTTHVRSWRDGNALDVRWTGSLAYPGVRLQLASGDTPVRFRYRSESGLVPCFVAYEGESGRIIVERLDRTSAVSAGWSMIWSGTDSLEHPLLITAASTFGLAAEEVRTLQLHLPDAEGFIATPFGVDGIASSVLRSWVRAGTLPDSVRRRILDLRSAATSFPTHSNLAYQIFGDSVRFQETFQSDDSNIRYERSGPPLLPVSPLMALAWRDGAYPVRIDGELRDTGIPTRLGPYLLHTDDPVTYTLPIPPLEATGLVRPTEGVDPDLLRLLNESVSDVRADGLRNALDLVYKSRASAYEAGPYLNDTNRAILRRGESDVATALDRRYWHDRTEPTTGLTYPWGYYIEGPRYGLYDIDWGNGLPLYGLMVHARATGDWSTIRRNWPEILRLNRYFQQFDDWAWMTASNADHGFGTGAGDCMGASYLAAISTAIMAKAIGDTVAYQEAAARSARVAVAVTMRFAIDRYAREHRLEKPGEFTIGYHETDGVLPIRADDYPWNYTSNISSNGVQPELFDLYTRTMPDRLRAYEDTLLAAHPHLFDGGYRYPTPTLYDGYSGYLTLPHLYAQLRLGASADSLRAWTLTAARNRTLWWLAPVVLGGILSRDVPVIVRSWTPARYVDGRYDRTARRAVLTFEPTEQRPVELVVQTPRPTTVLLNDRPVTDWTYSSGRLRLTLIPIRTAPLVVTLNLPTP